LNTQVQPVRAEATSSGQTRAGKLDKYYTNRKIALWLKRAVFDLLGDRRPAHIVEPSAGGGAFLEPGDGIVPFDLMPTLFDDAASGFEFGPEAPAKIEREGIGHWRNGALQVNGVHPAIVEIMRWAGITDLMAIGNPPFGSGGRLALQFVNSYLEIGGLVAFILPICFRRWSVQRQVDPSARLVLDLQLPADVFQTLDGRPYNLACCFQVWSTRPEEAALPDLRLRTKPTNRSPDFDAWTATGQNDPAFQRDYDFGVLCQGSGRYSERLLPGYVPTNLRRHMLFKAKGPDALERLQRIDFERLSQSWAPVAGFGIADVIAAYQSAD
jgi:hypothetical protein